MYYGESDTQKNWNDFFNRPHKPKSGVKWSIIIFMMLCLISAAIYTTFCKNDTTPPRNIDDGPVIVSQDNPTTQASVIEHKEETTKVYKFESDKELATISNGKKKLSKDDAEAIDYIMNILDNTIGQKPETLDKFKDSIININMKSGFTAFKYAALDKINFYIKYLENREPKYIDYYNSINIINILAECFDVMDIAYEIDNKSNIHYWYRE